MHEGIRNVALLVWALCAVNSNSYASDDLVIAEEAVSAAPTVVYGAAKEAGGGSDSVVIEQPAGAPNPLGNPISVPGQNENTPATAEGANATAPAENSDNIPMNTTSAPQVNPNTVQGQKALGKDFQNTLLEANGMVYDVQAYPEEDLKAIGNPSDPATLYSPNVNP